MAEQTLRRADTLLTELVELVETARTVPMSSSCVVHREQVLDLLDDLREVLPPEIDEARAIISARDAMLHEAYTEAGLAREQARAVAESTVTDAQRHAAQLIHDAEARSYEIIEQGKAAHAELVSATRVHQEATAAAITLRADAENFDRHTRAAADEYRDVVRAAADEYGTTVRTAADRYSFERRRDADAYAAKLSCDSDDYADRTLAELAQVLQRAAATAEQGRVAIAQRRAYYAPVQQVPEPDPAVAAAPTPSAGDVAEAPRAGEDSEQWRDAALSA
jgi:hypothetical protein